MGLCLSTTSRLRSTERIRQDRISGVFQPQSPNIISIHILDDDSLLNIFDLYRPLFLGEDEMGLDHLIGGRKEWFQGRWWYRLAHVCQRWRNLILASASHLRLSLVCTQGTPVEKMLANSPPLPLTVDYHSDHGIAAEDEEGILLALEQRHRIRHLRLGFPEQILRKLVMAIDEEFPTLEYLIMNSTEESSMLVLPETLQAPHLRQLMLRGFACPTRPRLHPTAASLVTLLLIINHPSAYFQPNILLRWISFLPQLEDLEIIFAFPVPNRDVDRQLTHAPITTHIALPNLRVFRFRGVSAYLEVVVCRITTPRLESLQILLFNQLTFSVPRLSQFMNITENLRFDSAAISFEDKSIKMGTFFRAVDTGFSVMVECQHLDWQVSSVVQISNALSQALSVVEHLGLGHNVHSQSSEEHNRVIDRIQWRNLFRSFNNLKFLYVTEGLVKELSHCLRLEDGELPLELLPELQELEYEGSPDAGDAFTSFIDARHNAGRPVTLVRHSPSPPLPEPAIAAPSDDAGSNTET